MTSNLQIHVAGACLLQVAPMTSDNTLSTSWSDLGYSMDGVNINERQLTEDVHGDENGGSRGTPIDIQKYGEIHRIEAVLTKWDEDIAATIRAGLRAGTQGAVGTIGALIFATRGGWQLSLSSTNVNRKYFAAVFSEPKTMNVGTKHSQLRLTATCYPIAGNVWQ